MGRPRPRMEATSSSKERWQYSAKPNPSPRPPGACASLWVAAKASRMSTYSRLVTTGAREGGGVTGG
jgi:hypothetical protein